MSRYKSIWASGLVYHCLFVTLGKRPNSVAIDNLPCAIFLSQITIQDHPATCAQLHKQCLLLLLGTSALHDVPHSLQRSYIPVSDLYSVSWVHCLSIWLKDVLLHVALALLPHERVVAKWYSRLELGLFLCFCNNLFFTREIYQPSDQRTTWRASFFVLGSA